MPIENNTYLVTIEGIVKKGDAVLTEEEREKIQWEIESRQDPEMLQFFRTHETVTEANRP